MRNYSSAVKFGNTIFVPSWLRSQQYDLIVECQTHLQKAMEVGALGFTPSEERVIEELHEWIESILDKDLVHNRPANSSFVYCNINTGESLVFVAWYGYGEMAGTFLI